MKQKPVKKLTDTFRTSDGRTMTRRQLSNLISRANYKVQQSRKYLSSKEYQRFKGYYEAGVQATGAYPEGQGKLTLAGITDPRKLRAIEKQARRALQSHFVSKKKYQDTEKKRFETFKGRGLIKNKDEYDLLMKLFGSEAWQKAVENDIIPSDQLLQLFQDEILAEGEGSPEVVEALNDIIAKYVLPQKENEEETATQAAEFEQPEINAPGIGKKKKKAPRISTRIQEMDDEEIAEAIIDELIDFIRSR